MSSLKLYGSTSGYVEVVPEATAGNNSVTLPNDSGTLVVGDSGGNLNISGIITATSVVSGAGSTASPSLSPTGDSNTGIFFPAADTIAFGEGGAESARFDSSSRFLLGTTSARSNFFNGSYTPQLQVEGTSISTTMFSIVGNSTSGAASPFIVLGQTRGSTVGSFTLVSSNELLGGIDFQGADGTDLVTAARIVAEVDGTPGANDMPGRLLFYTTADGASSPTERARLTSKGYFKASNTGNYNGATGDYHEFVQNSSGQINAIFKHDDASSPVGIQVFYSTAVNNTANVFLQCYDSSATRLTIRSNGGIANYSANNVNLSDRNAKKDISPAAGTWDCLKEWEIVNFRYKDQPDDADLNMGVIAQQVAESCPEVITVFQEAKEATETEPAQEEKLGVKDQQMMWMAIKALQEAQTRIETLEAEVAALKNP